MKDKAGLILLLSKKDQVKIQVGLVENPAHVQILPTLYGRDGKFSGCFGQGAGLQRA